MNYSSMLLKMVDISVIVWNNGYDKCLFKYEHGESFGTSDVLFLE